jgi:hypothetical protein
MKANRASEVIGGTTDAGECPAELPRCTWQERAANPGYNIEGPADDNEMRHNPGMQNTMDEFKRGALHSGSKKGPIVKSRAQAIAIGMNSAKRAS